MDVFFFSFFFLSDGFLKIDDCIDLMFINGRYKKKKYYFHIFFFYFLFHHLSFRKNGNSKGAHSC